MNSRCLWAGAGRITPYAKGSVQRRSKVSARDLAREIVQRGVAIDGAAAKDDISCAVIYFRTPRKLLIATGPPFSRGRDAEMVRTVELFDGRRVICGGTTASIVGRILDVDVDMELDQPIDPQIPPVARMPGMDLVTEGTLTLGEGANPESERRSTSSVPNAARRLVYMLMDSDIVQFLVGTRINEAHQDPNIPVELDLRRNIIKRIATQLEQKFLKQTSVRYLGTTRPADSPAAPPSWLGSHRGPATRLADKTLSCPRSFGAAFRSSFAPITKPGAPRTDPFVM